MKKLITLSILLSATICYGAGERRFIRSGNKAYEKGAYNKAEVNYLRALAIDSLCNDAIYNMGNVKFKEGKMEEAAGYYSKVLADSIHNENVASTAFNLGNSLVKQRKLEDAIAAYKKSLIANPTDTLAKQNLAYAQELLRNDKQSENKDNKEDKDKDNSDNKEQDKEQNQDNQEQNKEQNQDNQEQNQNQDNKNQNQDQDRGQDNEQPSEGAGELSQKEAEQMLDAIQRSEDKTQKKLNDKKGVVIGGSGKNW